MEVDVGIEVVLVEGFDQRCEALREMAIAQVFADDGAVFTFRQGIVVGVSGAGFGQLDQQRVEQFGHVLVDVLGAVVGVKPENDKGKLFQQRFQHRDQIALADFLRRTTW